MVSLKEQHDDKSDSHGTGHVQTTEAATKQNGPDDTFVEPPPTSLKNGHHIPPKKFAPVLIALLLDQNSNLASLGQQCIVAVAEELASTPADSDRADLNRYLLDSEIFDGVLMGLMDIVHGKKQLDKELNTEGEEEGLSADLSAASLNKDSLTTATTGMIRRPSATPGFEASISTHEEDTRQGEINLAKMMCLMVMSLRTIWRLLFSQGLCFFFVVL